MSNNYSDQYIEVIRKYLHGNPDAQSWITLYGIYAHSIDDIIDGERTDNKHILFTFETGLMLYSHIFYQRNFVHLYALCKMAHTAYADSVHLERSEDAIDKLIADPLRQYGNEIILAVIEIVSGKEARDAASIELRKISYRTHHLKDGTPV